MSPILPTSVKPVRGHYLAYPSSISNNSSGTLCRLPLQNHCDVVGDKQLFINSISDVTELPDRQSSCSFQCTKYELIYSLLKDQRRQTKLSSTREAELCGHGAGVRSGIPVSSNQRLYRTREAAQDEWLSTVDMVQGSGRVYPCPPTRDCIAPERQHKTSG
ncbi:hypothetical protein RRG08_066657 [Elysia crispata]|uniref:Uncharacterized protein n=1 Tax=Elysia crispata TaxID=231223 RepID=A0AAE1AAU5_9GAST|nr:hypothetical protein RRG08_066657 [Elysia crispata]